MQPIGDIATLADAGTQLDVSASNSSHAPPVQQTQPLRDTLRMLAPDNEVSFPIRMRRPRDRVQLVERQDVAGLTDGRQVLEASR